MAVSEVNQDITQESEFMPQRELEKWLRQHSAMDVFSKLRERVMGQDEALRKASILVYSFLRNVCVCQHDIKNKGSYIVSEGKHEAIISEDLWEASCRKRIEMGGKKEKIEKDHEYILSGIIVCPCCGKRMMGVPSRGKARADGTLYPTYYSYKCRASTQEVRSGTKCRYGQIACDKIDIQIRDIIMALVKNDTFADEITRLISEKVDDKYAQMQLESAITDYQKALKQQRKIEVEMDALDVFDKHYDRKYDSLSRRLESVFDNLDDAQRRRAEAEAQLESIRQKTLTQESIYQALRFFVNYYDKMTDREKKTFMQSFIDKIELFPEKSRKDGVCVKSIHFLFPVSYNGELVYHIDFSRPKEKSVESVVCLSRKQVSDYLHIAVNTEDLETDVGRIYTNDDIKQYIEEKYGFKVHSAYIGQVREKLGIHQHENYHDSHTSPRKPCVCPEEKETAILDALKHFGLIQ